MSMRQWARTDIGKVVRLSAGKRPRGGNCQVSSIMTISTSAQVAGVSLVDGSPQRAADTGSDYSHQLVRPPRHIRHMEVGGDRQTPVATGTVLCRAFPT
jgi:hypothetical protein